MKGVLVVLALHFWQALYRKVEQSKELYYIYRTSGDEVAGSSLVSWCGASRKSTVIEKALG